MLFASGNNRHYVLGYDIGDDVSQISYMAMDADMPETLSILAGAELYNIPTVLCKRNDVNQWFYGKEAIKHAQGDDGILIDHILLAIKEGKRINVDDKDFDPVTLLTLFIKRTLSLLSMELSLEYVDGVMFTMEGLNHRMIQAFKTVSEGLGLKNAKIFYQSHEESFFNYMIYQPDDMLRHTVLAYDYNFGAMKVYRMKFNPVTKPVVVTIDSGSYLNMELPKHSIPDDPVKKGETITKLDNDFYEIVEKECEGKIVSSVFLLGDGFRDGWTKKSLEFLCKKRRVFQGNNLFSKGASIAARIRLEEKREETSRYVYLGDDKLKANVGMKIQKQGVECYHALLDAGVNWFDASTTLEAIIETGNKISLQVVPLTGGGSRTVNIILDGLDERESRTTRILMHMNMVSATRLKVMVKDLGFGEIVPSSEKIWNEEFNVID